MADNEQILIGGISAVGVKEYTIQDLAPNNYLTIVWHNSKGEEITSLDIDYEKYNKYLDGLMSALNTTIEQEKVNYVGQNRYVNLESVAKYIAQNVFKTSPQRTVVNALIGLISGGTKKIDDSTINLIINMFGGITDKVARHFGFSDPHEIFASFMSENTISVLKVWGDKTQEYIDSVKEKFHKNKENATPSIETITQKLEDNKTIASKQYAGLLLGLTTSDTESYDINIAKKKVEQGSDYTTHILPQQFKKDFTVKLTNKVWTSNFDRIKEINEIERVKDKLIEIAKSRIPFDIYIRLSNDKMYKRKNVYFTSLSFSKDENSGDSYECTFSIEPIIEFKTKTFISDRKYFPTPSKTGTNGNGGVSRSGGSGNNTKIGSSSGGKISNKSSKGDTFRIEYLFNPNAKVIEAKNLKDAIYRCRQQGLSVYLESSAYGEQVIKYVKNSEVTTVNGVKTIIKDTDLEYTPTKSTGAVQYAPTRKFKKGFSKNIDTDGVRYKDKSTYKIYQ